MRKIRILLAENNEDFLAALADYFDPQKYQVFQATSPAAARQVLADEYVHVGVIDQRLTNNLDDLDHSGLELVQDYGGGALKLFVLTAYDSTRAARQAFRGGGFDYLLKEDGIEDLLETVARAEAALGINFELEIAFNPQVGVSVDNLVQRLEPELPAAQLPARAEEFSDLLRKLFCHWEQIEIAKLLWRQPGRMALIVRATGAAKPPQTFLVVCGQRELLQREQKNYADFAPRKHGPHGTIFEEQQATPRYGARRYICVGANLDAVQTLQQVYEQEREKPFNHAVAQLFLHVLPAWHQEATEYAPFASLDAFYRERLGLTPAHGEVLRAKLAWLAENLPRLELKVEQSAARLSLGAGPQAPHPALVLEADLLPENPLLALYAPGSLAAETILVESDKQLWLTDFHRAGLAPRLWNYVSLEAQLRFDLCKAASWQELLALEQELLRDRFDLLNTDAMGDEKALLAIQRLRQLAQASVRQNTAPYHLGIYYQALKRLTEIETNTRSASQRLSHLMRAAHLVLVLVLLGDKLSKGKPVTPLRQERGLRLDPVARTLWLNGVEKDLSKKRSLFPLLEFLHAHLGRDCSYKAILEHLGYVYPEHDPEQKRAAHIRLNVSISRLREELGDSAHAPQLIVNVPSGYKLVAPAGA